MLICGLYVLQEIVSQEDLVFYLRLDKKNVTRINKQILPPLGCVPMMVDSQLVYPTPTSSV